MYAGSVLAIEVATRKARVAQRSVPAPAGVYGELAVAAEVSFIVDVPVWFRPGMYWALLKVMHFGRRHYSEAIPVEVLRAD